MSNQADCSSLGSLADPRKFTGPVELHDHSGDLLRSMLERMLTIRRGEEMIGDLVTDGTIKCPCHLAIGQEACAVGVGFAVDRKKDRAFGGHRSHGHYLALGGDIDELLAEVLGKATGCSRGMGGSMHLVAPEIGLYGTVPIVGATIPIAVGAALAARLTGSGGLAISFFGDGATEEGVFHESMNLASTHQLPVIFACENNLFASHLQISLRQPADGLCRYAVAHKIAFAQVDGNDVVAVYEAATEAAARARNGGGPTFIEMVTYRWRGHVGPRDDNDVGVRRSEDLSIWKDRDPIKRLSSALIRRGDLDEKRLRELDATIAAVLENAVEAAVNAPYPSSSATTDYMYSKART